MGFLIILVTILVAGGYRSDNDDLDIPTNLWWGQHPRLVRRRVWSYLRKTEHIFFFFCKYFVIKTVIEKNTTKQNKRNGRKRFTWFSTKLIYSTQTRARNHYRARSRITILICGSLWRAHGPRRRLPSVCNTAATETWEGVCGMEKTCGGYF